MSSYTLNFPLSICDGCNPSGYTKFNPRLPNKRAPGARGRLPRTWQNNWKRLLDGHVEKGEFFGSPAEAQAAGWEERDFGDVCKDCVTKEKEQEARDTEEQAESFIGAPSAEGIDRFMQEQQQADVKVEEMLAGTSKTLAVPTMSNEQREKLKATWEADQAQVYAQAQAIKIQAAPTVVAAG